MTSSSKNRLCARWGCGRQATQEKPLCYDDWLQWDTWELEECPRCQWFLEGPDFWGPFRPVELNLEHPDFCAQCRYVALVEAGRVGINPDQPPENRPIASHAQLVRRVRYVYVLKLSDGSFYVGRTTDLTIRLQEHGDGLQRQTKGKDPRLVYYESFEGKRDSVNEREAELSEMNQSWVGRRRLRQMIERFRAPLRLLDLEA